jgi:hypothetical protein
VVPQRRVDPPAVCGKEWRLLCPISAVYIIVQKLLLVAIGANGVPARLDGCVFVIRLALVLNDWPVGRRVDR